ncbi:hypothetical protein Tco_1478377, partial [Tanacetum coccineum]
NTQTLLDPINLTLQYSLLQLLTSISASASVLPFSKDTSFLPAYG